MCSGPYRRKSKNAHQTNLLAMSLSESIKEKARELGFQLAGITTPDPPPHYSVFERWLRAGLHGEMDYLASEHLRQRRQDPRLILPGCRSILVLGVRYPVPSATPIQSGEIGGIGSEAARSHQENYFSLPLKGEGGSSADRREGRAGGGGGRSPSGRVASYAWGDDYHDVLAERLRLIVAFIETQIGYPVPNRWYTDTGPILERDLAQRAGLGWIGKNTCLIHPQLGSYFLLAEVLLGIDLDADPPFLPDRCGSCTRCIDACPTGCILPDRTINSTRCISYLTIELKGAIPIDLRPQMGDWVFGCDVCQQVCPWNQRFASAESDPAFAPRPALPAPDLPQELALSPQDFNRKFKGSPVKRSKRRGYLRNVAIALGNSGDPAAVPALTHALKQDPEPLVRSHAAWALGQIGGDSARKALKEALHAEQEVAVLLEVRAALGVG